MQDEEGGSLGCRSSSSVGALHPQMTPASLAVGRQQSKGTITNAFRNTVLT